MKRASFALRTTSWTSDPTPVPKEGRSSSPAPSLTCFKPTTASPRTTCWAASTSPFRNTAALGVGTFGVRNAKEHNLQGVDADFRLGALNVVTGVSGSGKSTLVKRILHPLLSPMLDLEGDRPGVSDGLQGDTDRIEGVEFVDQNPIGKSSRSNPATYVKAWDDVRSLFAAQPLARNRGYKPLFSFNTSEGRCKLRAKATLSIGMQFMADVTLTDACKGHRFTDAVLEITVDGRNIDILNMTVADARLLRQPSQTHCSRARASSALRPCSRSGWDTYPRDRAPPP